MSKSRSEWLTRPGRIYGECAGSIALMRSSGIPLLLLVALVVACKAPGPTPIPTHVGVHVPPNVSLLPVAVPFPAESPGETSLATPTMTPAPVAPKVLSEITAPVSADEETRIATLDGQLEVVTPANSLPPEVADMTVEVELKIIDSATVPAPPVDTHLIRSIEVNTLVDGQASAVTYAKPVILRIPLTPEELALAGHDPSKLMVFRYNPDTDIWDPVPTTFKETPAPPHLEAKINTFSLFAVGIFQPVQPTPTRALIPTPSPGLPVPPVPPVVTPTSVLAPTSTVVATPTATTGLTPTAEATPTQTPTIVEATPTTPSTPTATATPTTTLTPTPISTPTATPSTTLTPTPTSTPAATPTTTPTPTVTPLPPPPTNPTPTPTPAPKPPPPPPGANVGPTAVITGDQKANSGGNVHFDGTDSFDPDGNVVRFDWSFGDGGVGTFVSGDHVYNSAGVFNVTLTVTDNNGATDSATRTVEVKRKWTLRLEISWEPRDVGGLSNLLLGVNLRCPETIGCSGPLPLSLPGADSFEVYICHPSDNKPPCKGRLLSKELLSKSFLSPDENVHRWVVEVTDSDQLLTEIRFSWDTSKLPPNFNLWIVDSAGRIDMKKPPSQPDSPRLYKLSMVSSDETKSFLICSQVTGVEVDNPCPKKLT